MRGTERAEHSSKRRKMFYLFPRREGVRVQRGIGSVPCSIAQRKRHSEAACLVDALVNLFRLFATQCLLLPKESTHFPPLSHCHEERIKP